MSSQLIQKAHDIEAILRRSRTSSGTRWPRRACASEIAEWKDEMICAVESEARNAVASIRLLNFCGKVRKSVRLLPIYNLAIRFALQ